eukprot:4889571-Pyramimonas_sp.AAC.1
MLILLCCRCACLRADRLDAWSCAGWSPLPSTLLSVLSRDARWRLLLIKAHGMEAFDSVPIAPNTALDINIDDTALNSVGSAETVVESLKESSAALEVEVAIIRMMRAQISMDKVACVASSKVIFRHEEAFGPLVGPPLEATVDMRIDFTAGTSRRVRGRNAKAKARLSHAAR